MPNADPSAAASLVLFVVVVLCAAGLAYREWAEERHRDPDLSEADSDYFARRRRRRYLGSALMIALAAGLVLGSRIELKGAGREVRQWFVAVWCGVGTLLFTMLSLAWADMMATRAYARRQRRAIVEEHRALIEEERRLRAVPKNGKAGPAGPIQEDAR